MERLIIKFVKIDIKRLEDDLADHALQSKFDIQAKSKLTKWEELVSEQTHHHLMTNLGQAAATHKALCTKYGM